jgi:hypothetical protein
MYPREVPQLMESYPQLIPKITKVVKPPKAYKRRHPHGDREENISEMCCHSDHGCFEQGVGQGGIGEATASASTNCKYLVMFSLIYAWHVSFKFMYDFIGLSLFDKSSLN